MKRARKVSNVHGEVHFKQKQGLIIVFAGNTSPPSPPRPHRKQFRKGTEDFIVDKIHAINMQLYHN